MGHQRRTTERGEPIHVEAARVRLVNGDARKQLQPFHDEQQHHRGADAVADDMRGHDGELLDERREVGGILAHAVDVGLVAADRGRSDRTRSRGGSASSGSTASQV